MLQVRSQHRAAETFSHPKRSRSWVRLLLTPLGSGISAFLAFKIYKDKGKKRAWKGREFRDGHHR